MKILFLLLSFFLISINSQARDLSVLTWNTFLVPALYNSSKQYDRAELMAKKLRALNRDVIFLQEAFIDTQRELIIKELAPVYPFVAVPKKGPGLFQFVGAGLLIASKYPMRILDQVVFRDCSGSDCFASKSAIIVELTLSGGEQVQMVDTHLQGWDNTEIRKKQLLQIKEMMKANARFGIAQVLVGDLNIDGKIKSEYADSLQLMNMTSSPLAGRLNSSNGFSTVGCFETPGGISKGEWLDHMWLKPNGSDTQIHSKKIVPILGLLGNSLCPLSDHYALEAKILVNESSNQHLAKVNSSKALKVLQ